jgi:molybdopterin converting factor small subunit
MATVSIRTPTPLRSFTAGAHAVSIQGNTVGDVIGTLINTHEGIGERIITPEGELRNFVNLFLGNHSIRNLNGLNLNGLQTPVSDGNVLSIVPAVAGGRP